MLTAERRQEIEALLRKARSPGTSAQYYNEFITCSFVIVDELLREIDRLKEVENVCDNLRP